MNDSYVNVDCINSPSDGAAAHFKNNVNILNIVRHKADFGLDACWTFTATGHGKGAGDGIGAVLKFTTRRVTLSKNILLSTAKDFYEFSSTHQLEATSSSNQKDPGIHVFFVASKELQEIQESIMKPRSEQLRSSGKWIFFLSNSTVFI